MRQFASRRLLLGAALAALATTAYARTETCHAATEKDIAGLFDRWNSSLATGDPKKVVANYATKSVLLATQEKVPEDCNLLIVPAPVKPYLDTEVKLLEDYLQGGGRALFLLAAQRGPELAPVLASYGIQMGNDIVVDQVLRLFQGPALGVEPMAQSYGRHPITEGFSQRTIFPFTRSVDAIGDKKPGVEVTSIVKTSPSSWAETDLDGLFKKGQAALDEKADRKGPISIGVAATVSTKKGDKDVQSRLVAFGSTERIVVAITELDHLGDVVASHTVRLPAIALREARPPEPRLERTAVRGGDNNLSLP